MFFEALQKFLLTNRDVRKILTCVLHQESCGSPFTGGNRAGFFFMNLPRCRGQPLWGSMRSEKRPVLSGKQVTVFVADPFLTGLGLDAERNFRHELLQKSVFNIARDRITGNSGLFTRNRITTTPARRFDLPIDDICAKRIVRSGNVHLFARH